MAAEADLAGSEQPAICGLIERGLRERTPVRFLARELRMLVPLDTQRSIDLVSYLLQRQAAALSSERAYQAGLGPRFEWVWGGNFDDPPHHKARSGKVIDWNDPVFDGEPIPFDDLPGMAPLCVSLR